MQQELVELQPKLIQTSKETAELIEFISKESIEVEAVKKVVEADEVVANNAAMDAKAIKVGQGQGRGIFCLIIYSFLLSMAPSFYIHTHVLWVFVV